LTVPARAQNWRLVRHPLQMVTRKGWTFGRACLISPRGTVFEFRRANCACFARRRRDWQAEREETNR